MCSLKSIYSTLKNWKVLRVLKPIHRFKTHHVNHQGPISRTDLIQSDRWLSLNLLMKLAPERYKFWVKYSLIGGSEELVYPISGGITSIVLRNYQHNNLYCSFLFSATKTKIERDKWHNLGISSHWSVAGLVSCLQYVTQSTPWLQLLQTRDQCLQSADIEHLTASDRNECYVSRWFDLDGWQIADNNQVLAMG